MVTKIELQLDHQAARFIAYGGWSITWKDGTDARAREWLRAAEFAIRSRAARLVKDAEAQAEEDGVEST